MSWDRVAVAVSELYVISAESAACEPSFTSARRLRCSHRIGVAKSLVATRENLSPLTVTTLDSRSRFTTPGMKLEIGARSPSGSIQSEEKRSQIGFILIIGDAGIGIAPQP